MLILGERYGWSNTLLGLSPTHEEFREGAAQGKIIPSVQSGVAREPAQEQFVAEVENYGMHRGKTFATPEQLRTEVTRAIARHQLSAATAPVNVSGMLETARQLIPLEDRGFVRMTGPLLHLSIVGGPSQTILRPSEIENPNTVETVIAASSTSAGYFSYRLRTKPRLEGGALVVEQENGSVFRIDDAIAMLLSIPIEQAQGYLKPLIEKQCTLSLGDRPFVCRLNAGEVRLNTKTDPGSHRRGNHL